MDALDGKGKYSYHKLNLLIEEVIQIKKVGGVEYQNLKVMGDAILRPIVLEYMYAKKGELDELTNTARIVLDNEQDYAMPKFFDSYIAREHHKQLPNEQSFLSAHGKADVVEALLELARRNDTKARVFKFMMSALLKSWIQ